MTDVHLILAGVNQTACGRELGSEVLSINPDVVTCERCVPRESTWELWTDCGDPDADVQLAGDLTLDQMGYLGHWGNLENGSRHLDQLAGARLRTVRGRGRVKR